MLRLKVITQWSDLYTELDSIINAFSRGFSANLNLLRRSIVAWKRCGPGPHECPGYRVSLSPQELEQLEVLFTTVHVTSLVPSPTACNAALSGMQNALEIVNRARVRCLPDREILALLNKPGQLALRTGLGDVLRDEMLRRGLSNRQTSRSPKMILARTGTTRTPTLKLRRN